MSDNSQQAPRLTSSEILEYMRIQWADVHHGNLLEFSALPVIAGVLYALAHLAPALQTGVVLGCLGFLSALVGGGMALLNQIVLADKLKLIRNLEEHLGITPLVQKSWITVHILVYLLYAGIASSFAAITSYWIFLAQPISLTHPTTISILIGFVIFAAFLAVVLVYPRSHIEGRSR
jgi:hypothetical protein